MPSNNTTPSALSYFRRDFLDRLKGMEAQLQRALDERAALEAKRDELDGRQRADAERVAAQRTAAVSALVGGAPELNIPVVTSSSDVLREALAQVERRLQYAKDNEADLRAQYRGALFSELQIAAGAIYGEVQQHAQELEKRIQLLLGVNQFAQTYATEVFNPMGIQALFVPAFEQLGPLPKAKAGYVRPTLVTSEDLGPPTMETMRGLERELEMLVGPAGRGFWKKPTTTEWHRRSAR